MAADELPEPNISVAASGPPPWERAVALALIVGGSLAAMILSVALLWGLFTWRGLLGAPLAIHPGERGMDIAETTVKVAAVTIALGCAALVLAAGVLMRAGRRWSARVLLGAALLFGCSCGVIVTIVLEEWLVRTDMIS